MKFLLADDSDIVRTGLTALLSNLKGIEIISAHNSREAMDKIRSLKPDVAILDIQMPGGDGMPDANGIDVLRSVKSRPGSPVIIMYTAYPYPQYRQKCLDEGADYFFDKKTGLRNLLDKVLDLIEHRDWENG